MSRLKECTGQLQSDTLRGTLRLTEGTQAPATGFAMPTLLSHSGLWSRQISLRSL